MPAAVSKRQYRYLMAILHGKKNGTSERGDRVPESVASKYTKPADGAVESKGKEHRGGKWTEAHHSAHKEREKKKKLKKAQALEQYLIDSNKKGAGCLVVNKDGKFLLGKRADTGNWATPGGHVERDESYEDAALRELKEEAGISGSIAKEIHSGIYRGYRSKTFLVTAYSGKINRSPEFLDLRWISIDDIPWDITEDYTSDAIAQYVKRELKKNKLEQLLLEEKLNKNIIRSGNAPSNTVYEVTHGDALKIVHTGTFRLLRDAVKGMTDEDFREVPLEHYVLHIRKHTNDVYSGRITDGHKQIHQFTNRSLPAVAVELMSVFEWYSPEDEAEIAQLNDDDISDDVIEGGMNALIEHYKRHNIVNIYQEMENIRADMRNGMAIDLQQVEQKMMKLFDKLEDCVMQIADKHNQLTGEAGKAIEEIEQKMSELYRKIDELNLAPTKIEAYTPTPTDSPNLHTNFYSYLPRPEIQISPDGKLTISFSSGWTHLERENFLKDMKAKVIKRG